MRIVYFTHSIASCWNHGNAHFLRGVLRELIALGHDVAIYEPQGAWSLENLLRDHGEAGLEPFLSSYPELRSTLYDQRPDFSAALQDADLVIVHEWNEPGLVAAVGRHRLHEGRYQLFFHDTHHRAVSDPDAIRRFDLSGYDGVLAFGEALAQVYRRWGWAERVFVWHEAADTKLFRPPAEEGQRNGIVWIGNWGDGERTAEIESFLLRPVRDAGATLDIYGVRYPDDALELLRRYGAVYRGWLPNARAPEVFARHAATVHVPRRYYAGMLPGIPTIRVFEALACGIPLISAPWQDSEHLFRQGQDYLLAESSDDVVRHLVALRADPELRQSLVRNGLATILSRHTCAHRAQELFDISRALSSSRILKAS